MLRDGKLVLFSDTVVKLHHYTSEDGWLEISAVGAIRMSQDSTADSILGTGVCLTPRPPLTYTGQILWKNWDGPAPWTTLENIQYCIMFDSKDLSGLKKSKYGRDVCMAAYDIYLNQVTPDL
jgi:hypothetical protein